MGLAELESGHTYADWFQGFVVVVQSLSCIRLFTTPWTAVCQASLSFTISRSLLKLMSIELVMPSNHLILSRPLLLLSSIFPSIRVFANELSLHTRWPKYWSFSISPFSEYSGLIFFRIHWFDLPAVQFLKVHFLYIGKCKRLGSLKFFWYVPQLSGASFPCFHILRFLGTQNREELQSDCC